MNISISFSNMDENSMKLAQSAPLFRPKFFGKSGQATHLAGQRAVPYTQDGLCPISHQLLHSKNQQQVGCALFRWGRAGGFITHCTSSHITRKIKSDLGERRGRVVGHSKHTKDSNNQVAIFSVEVVGGYYTHFNTSLHCPAQ